jgi:riboflavin kinase/FMN adenylyltransferase
MKLAHTAKEIDTMGRKVSLCIGFFDGVHLGHQQIMRQTIADARRFDALSAVVTFDLHPSTVVAPERTPLLIHSLPQRLRAIESMDADALLMIHFDKPLSERTGEEFIRSLHADFGRIQSICVGNGFTFGHKRSGNVTMLSTLGGELGFNVHGLASVALGGETISSTRIRETIRTGGFDLAGEMLGRAYALNGEIIHGDRLGHGLGFPTANLNTQGLVLPPNGVYTVQAYIRNSRHNGLVNIGARPSIKNSTLQIRAEVHLLDFNGDIYGEEMEIVFKEKIREEMKFNSLEDLKKQIAKDVVEARKRF